MSYSRKFLIKVHRDLWGWLAENPEKRKEDWPRWKDNGGNILNLEMLCPACALDAQSPSDRCGLKCLFIWDLNFCGESEFGKYIDAISPGQKTFYAEKIRDLKVNPIYMEGLPDNI